MNINTLKTDRKSRWVTVAFPIFIIGASLILIAWSYVPKRIRKFINAMIKG
jgi:ABC-type transport system involved in cytochrome c biogenesis permease subunit